MRVALDCRIRLIVILVCGSSQSQRFGGKPSRLHRLRCWGNGLWSCVWLTLAALRLWHTGGTNSMSSLHVSRMWFFMFSDTSLSRTCFLGTMPARFSWSRSSLYARIILVSLQLFMGMTRMALLSISTITMMYLLPWKDPMENWPVWSENMVLRTMYVWVYMLRTYLPRRWKVSHVSNSATFALVGCTFFLVWFRCPFEVLVVSG